MIDSMHNLLLGTAKHVLSVWNRQESLENHISVRFKSKVDTFITPTDIGHIPGKITSGFSSFTAEQWRNWTLFLMLSKRDPPSPPLRLLAPVCEKHKHTLPLCHYITRARKSRSTIDGFLSNVWGALW